MKITNEQFVEVWQRASSVCEVAEAAGVGTAICSAKAGYFRKKGVPLKKLSRHRGNQDWAALASLAVSITEASQ